MEKLLELLDRHTARHLFRSSHLNICFINTAPQAASFKHKPCINKVALPFYLLQKLNIMY